MKKFIAICIVGTVLNTVLFYVCVTFFPNLEPLFKVLMLVVFLWMAYYIFYWEHLDNAYTKFWDAFFEKLVGNNEYRVYVLDNKGNEWHKRKSNIKLDMDIRWLYITKINHLPLRAGDRIQYKINGRLINECVVSGVNQ
jgi:hypothetical protein